MVSDDPIPISLVAQAVFCPRRAWLEAAGEQADSAQMEAGYQAHARVDDPKQSRPGEWRSVGIHHAELGITGRCDLVTLDEGHTQVVEYKAASVRRPPEVNESKIVQLHLQIMCLESAGVTIDSAAVYFTNHRKYIDVELSDAGRSVAVEWVRATRAIVEAKAAPAPLIDDARCRGCSHAGVCLPDEHRAEGVPRRISVADPDGEIMHVTVPGARVSLKSGRVVVYRDEQLASLPLETIRGLVLHGNIDCSSALLRELMWRRLAVVWCSGRGRVVGWSQSADSPNGQVRVLQHVLSHDGSLLLAREMIVSKISNQATQLRRNSIPHVDVADFRVLAKRAKLANSLTELFGIEGEAAATYFQNFASMLRGTNASLWSGREGRHATDPLNASLNYAYSLLLGDCIRALVACGLDPSAGFLHSSNRNKPALALDLMEEFRAPVADSVVLRAFNNGELRESDFTSILGDCRIRDEGRKRLIAAYERRVQEEFSHPVYHYKISWRRAIEVQARMILGFLDGTAASYRGIRIR